MISKNKITTIIFDVGNVLLAFNPNAPLELSVQAIPELVTLLNQLHKHYKIFALTDGNPQQITYESNTFPFYQKFTHVLTPQESGYAKNDPNMYQYFLNKFALQPDECVFIDDKQENVYAAQQTGMYTIVYRTIHQLKDRLDQLDIIS